MFEPDKLLEEIRRKKERGGSSLFLDEDEFRGKDGDEDEEKEVPKSRGERFIGVNVDGLHDGQHDVQFSRHGFRGSDGPAPLSLSTPGELRAQVMRLRSRLEDKEEKFQLLLQQKEESFHERRRLLRVLEEKEHQLGTLLEQLRALEEENTRLSSELSDAEEHRMELWEQRNDLLRRMNEEREVVSREEKSHESIFNDLETAVKELSRQNKQILLENTTLRHQIQQLSRSPAKPITRESRTRLKEETRFGWEETAPDLEGKQETAEDAYAEEGLEMGPEFRQTSSSSPLVKAMRSTKGGKPSVKLRLGGGKKRRGQQGRKVDDVDEAEVGKEEEDLKEIESWLDEKNIFDTVPTMEKNVPKEQSRTSLKESAKSAKSDRSKREIRVSRTLPAQQDGRKKVFVARVSKHSSHKPVATAIGTLHPPAPQHADAKATRVVGKKGIQKKQRWHGESIGPSKKRGSSSMSGGGEESSDAAVLHIDLKTDAPAWDISPSRIMKGKSSGSGRSKTITIPTKLS